MNERQYQAVRAALVEALAEHVCSRKEATNVVPHLVIAVRDALEATRAQLNRGKPAATGKGGSSKADRQAK